MRLLLSLSIYIYVFVFVRVKCNYSMYMCVCQAIHSILFISIYVPFFERKWFQDVPSQANAMRMATSCCIETSGAAAPWASQSTQGESFMRDEVHTVGHREVTTSLVISHDISCLMIS